MTIVLPDHDLEGLKLTPEQARLDLAVGLYAGRRVSLGRAARVGGVTHTEFLHELGHRRICINYTVEDAEHDVAMAHELAAEYDTK